MLKKCHISVELFPSVIFNYDIKCWNQKSHVCLVFCHAHVTLDDAVTHLIKVFARIRFHVHVRQDRRGHFDAFWWQTNGGVWRGCDVEMAGNLKAKASLWHSIHYIQAIVNLWNDFTLTEICVNTDKITKQTNRISTISRAIWKA